MKTEVTLAAACYSQVKLQVVAIRIYKAERERILPTALRLPLKLEALGGCTDLGRVSLYGSLEQSLYHLTSFRLFYPVLAVGPLLFHVHNEHFPHGLRP